MDGEAPLPTYRQASWGITSRNAPLIAPLPIAAGWVIADSWREHLTISSLIFSGLVGAIGLLGLAAALVPVELIADSEGLHWRQLLTRRSIPWSEIENIGSGVSKSFQGYDKASVRLLTGRRWGPRPPTIGINLLAKQGNRATIAYRRGFTGFDLNLTNFFPERTQQIVMELQMRLERSRRPASTIHPSPTLLPVKGQPV